MVHQSNPFPAPALILSGEVFLFFALHVILLKVKNKKETK
jgi:hypothetical protein